MSVTSISPKRKGPGRPRGSHNRTSGSTLSGPLPVTMRTPTAAHYVDVSVSLMKRWIREGRVRSTAIGGVRLVYVASLNELVNAG
jgi:excisionase family DNA binding protein